MKYHTFIFLIGCSLSIQIQSAQRLIDDTASLEQSGDVHRPERPQTRRGVDVLPDCKEFSRQEALRLIAQAQAQATTTPVANDDYQLPADALRDCAAFLAITEDTLYDAQMANPAAQHATELVRERAHTARYKKLAITFACSTLLALAAHLPTYVQNC